VTTAALLYDRDCGLCRWAAGKALAWDRHHRLRPVALESPEAEQLLPGLDHDTKMGSWHLVTDDGLVYSAGAAVAPLFRMLPGGEPLALLARAFPGTTARLYRRIAQHRGTLAQWLGARVSTADPTASDG